METGVREMPKERRDIALIGTPVDCGAGQRGCLMGSDALRTAGLPEALEGLGHRVEDLGDVSPAEAEPISVSGNARQPARIRAWTRAITEAGRGIGPERVPVFMGGDHALAMGSINAMALRAEAAGRPLHVLWLDAHSDYNTPKTSPSGNMHGMPVAAVCGEPELEFVFEGYDRVRMKPAHFHMFGIRSVDEDERRLIARRGVDVMDMRAIDEAGVAPLIGPVLEQVAEEGAMLHVSLDVDFLDPSIAPGVGTTVPGGATYREAHLIMEMLNDSGLVTSLDLVELNPFLDERGKSALALVDLTASLFGRKIIDRPRAARLG